MNFKKLLLTASLIAAAGIMTGCNSKPTLDRSIVEGYNSCVAANAKAKGDLAAANSRAAGEAAANGRVHYDNTFYFDPRDCKSEFGISFFREISDYRIIN